MKKQLTHIAPLRAGIVLGVVYGLLGLVFLPVFLFLAAINSNSGAHSAVFPSMLVGVLFPVIYAVAGFVGGVLAAAIYNLVAKWTGGLEFEVKDVSQDS